MNSVANKEVKLILEKGGLWSFIKKFIPSNVELANALAHSWKEGKVADLGVKLRVNVVLVKEVVGLPMNGINLIKENYSLKNEVYLFRK